MQIIEAYIHPQLPLPGIGSEVLVVRAVRTQDPEKVLAARIEVDVLFACAAEPIDD